MSAAGVAEMAKAKRGKVGRPSSGRDEVPVKIDRVLAARLKMIAGYRGVSVGELLSDMARDPIDYAYGQMVRDLDARQGGKQK
jgi:hypothetical protein